MPQRYAILGAGRQGMAIAYALLRFAGADQVTLLDHEARLANDAAARLARLLPRHRDRIHSGACDVRDTAAVRSAIEQADVACSAVPYRFNVDLTRAAIEAGTSLCDLGGNTDIVRAQLAMHDEAARRGVSIVPDCGLAPGLGNILAACGIARLDEPHEAHIRCGGLPQRPVGPLGYKLLFNFEGLINEYSGQAEFLRDGRRTLVPTLSELEEIEFPPPVGRCEAAVTSGGTSTCPETFEGRLREYTYKTVRYPGHWTIIRAMFGLGLFERRVTLSDGRVIEPLAVVRPLMEDRLRFDDVHDITVLRVTVRGRHQGQPASVCFELIDRHDERTGLSSMERTTAFPTALVARMQAEGHIAPGAATPERCLPLEPYVQQLAAFDLRVAYEQTGPLSGS